MTDGQMTKFPEPDSQSHPFLRVLHTLISEPPATESAGGSFLRDMPFWSAGTIRPGRQRRAAARNGAFGEFSEPAEDEAGIAHRPAAATVSAEDIRRELAISHAHSISDLKRIRKSFAARNHPDIVAGPMRGGAEQRMKLANAIIDSEIVKRRRQAG